MSLINRMLQDLEARRAAEQEQTLLRDVRPLPVRRESSWLRPVATGALLLVLLGGGFVLWQQSQDRAVSVPPAEPPKPVAVTPPVPLPPSAPIQAAPAPAEVVATPAAATAAAPSSPPLEPAAQTPVAVSAAPQPSPAIPPPAPIGEAQKAVPAAAEPAKPAAKSEVRGQEKDDGLKVATSLAPASPKPVKAEPPPPAVIEKKVRNVSPRERAESDYRRAQALLGQGRANDALAGFAAALQADPTHVGARVDLVSLLIELQRLPDAQALLEEGLGLSPGQTQLTMRLARIQAERGELRAAAQTLQKAAAASAGHAEFRAFHAAVLQRLTLHKEAITEYQAAVQLAPQAGVWWMGLGISLEAEGRHAEARQAYLKARASGVLSAELDRFVEQKLRQPQ
jgi:MSHA biogenesis protein MshN